MAEIASSLRVNGYEGELWGMGAAESRAAAVTLKWQGERLQLFGFTEVFGAIPFVLKLLKDMTEAVISKNPEAVVVVDSPDFHLRLLGRLRRAGYKGAVFYVSPPTVWAWRSGRIKYLRRYVTECFPLYQFEHDYFSLHGCNSYWSGAPLLEEFVKRGNVNIPQEFEGNDKIVAFMPGSRKSEVTKLLPVMKEVAKIVEQHGFEPIFSVAPGLNEAVREMLLQQFETEGLRHFDGAGRELMAAAQCSVSASGTITVESLLLEKFMVSVYKMNALSGWIANRIVKSRWFTMTNIIAGSEIYPEFFQNKCTAKAVSGSLLDYLEGSEEYKAEVARKLKETKAKLGETGVYNRWAQRIMEKTGC